MGIAKGALSLLYELKRDHGYGGKMLELGKQDVHINCEQLLNVQKKFGIKNRLYSRDLLGKKIDHKFIFQELGFDSVECLDYSDYQGAEIICDFNLPVDLTTHNQYDFVYDGGTLEHIFNFPQCLKNIHNLLKVGGLVVHHLPSHNHVDHGFYMFSPTIFYDYYKANNYKIIKAYVHEYDRDHAGKAWTIYNYEPGCLDRISYGGWGRKMLGIWFVAQKTEESRCDIIPQQGAYIKTWSNEEFSEDNIKNRVKSFVRSYPVFFRIVKDFYRLFIKILPIRQWRPKVIARY
jgi:hypothetical protein